MKKFVVLLAVVAMTLVSAMAFAAAEVSVSGEMAVRSRDFSNPDGVGAMGADKDTQQRVQLSVNAKAGDTKAKLTLWNDFEGWDADGVTATGTGHDKANGSAIAIRESWISFNLPGIPVNVTAGHQLLTLGNGWFFRSMHFGSDAWVIANQSGNNTIAAVNVKFDEGTTSRADDIDAYVLLDVMKLSDTLTIGADLTNLKQKGTDLNLYNVGLNMNGKFGALALKAQLDLQGGDYDSATSFGGNQIVIQGSMPLDPVTVNFTLARGSGDDTPTDDTIDRMVTALDIDPHYTFLYEYKMETATGEKNTGFSNTTALGIGASYAATKSLTIGADLWLLQATEDVALGGGAADSDLGQEIDVKINWNVAENLSWNWNLGMFMPGDAYGSSVDDATGIQGILSFKF